MSSVSEEDYVDFDKLAEKALRRAEEVSAKNGNSQSRRSAALADKQKKEEEKKKAHAAVQRDENVRRLEAGDVPASEEKTTEPEGDYDEKKKKKKAEVEKKEKASEKARKEAEQFDPVKAWLEKDIRGSFFS